MLQLKLRTSLKIPLEAPCLAPNLLHQLSNIEIARLPVQHGNAVGVVGDYFDVAGAASDADIQISGDCSRVNWLGAKMTAGSLTIRGPVGLHTGSGMIGGALHVEGDCDDWLGAEMLGGVIHVRGGNAANHCGAAYPGNTIGLRGGTILVDGTSGDGTGAVMRRGLIVAGGCGDFAGASMIAGNLLVFGPIGKFAGANMKRGTIVAFADPPEILPTFRPSCEYEPTFLDLYRRKLRRLNWASLSTPRVFRRYCGDMVSLGLGEILVRV